MSEFELDREVIPAQQGGLERTVSAEQINEQAAKKAKLQELRQERMDLLRRLEQADRANIDGSFTEAWDNALEDVVLVYEQRDAINGVRRVIYTAMERIGLNPYQMKAQRVLSRARNKSAGLKRQLDHMDRRLHSRNGRQGEAVKLDSVTQKVTAYADTYISLTTAVNHLAGMMQ